MSSFDYLFPFYGLLLGIAATNAAIGFAEMWKGREEIPVGWTPPLLGLYILLQVAQKWSLFWQYRESYGPERQTTTILLLMVYALPLIFVSTAMFPRTLARWTSVEQYYLENRRALLGVLLIPPVVGVAFFIVQRIDFDIGWVFHFFIPIALFVAMINRPSAWLNRIGMVLLCVNTLIRMYQN
jgi:hypothetical protein